jgi:hypothetical protein
MADSAVHAGRDQHATHRRARRQQPVGDGRRSGCPSHMVRRPKCSRDAPTTRFACRRRSRPTQDGEPRTTTRLLRSSTCGRGAHRYARLAKAARPLCTAVLAGRLRPPVPTLERAGTARGDRAPMGTARPGHGTLRTRGRRRGQRDRSRNGWQLSFGSAVVCPDRTHRGHQQSSRCHDRGDHPS